MPRQPFHWCLEFPEVFSSERLGFDSVVANPPFVDSETMTKFAPLERTFLAKHYSCTKGNWDLFVAFIEKALSITGPLGSTSLVSPNKWLGAPYGSALRKRTAMSIVSILDFSKGRAFAGVGVAAVCTNFRLQTQGPVSIITYPRSRGDEAVLVDRSQLIENSTWGFLLSSNTDILMELSRGTAKFGDYVSAHDPFTVSEAYDLKPLVKNLSSGDFEFFRFVNTGTIDPFVTLWNERKMRYLKSSYRMPIVYRQDLREMFPRRYEQARRAKIIMSGMRKFEAFLDESGDYLAGKSSVVATLKHPEVSLVALVGILNSTLMRFYVQESFGVLGIDGGISFSGRMIEGLPLPESFAGSSEAIETAVFSVLNCLRKGKPATNELKMLDDVVFAEYGVAIAFRERIGATKLRC